MARDENFPVAFLLAPRAVRADMAAIYRFCRATDDLGDEGPGDPAARLEALDVWEAGLLAAVAGGDAPAPLTGAAEVIARRALPLAPFRRLIEANRMDQRRARWETHAELLEYCRHSATPVGEMVLGVLGYRDAWRIGLSDATCCGLQLVNFWQDVARDLRDRDRIYLPAEAMERFGVAEDDLRRPAASPAVRALVAEQVGLARDLLVAGEPLYRLVPRRVALDMRMFTIGGLALCDAIARQDHDTLARRPAPGALGRARIAATAIRLLTGRRRRTMRPTRSAGRSPARRRATSTTASCCCRPSGARASTPPTPSAGGPTTASTRGDRPTAGSRRWRACAGNSTPAWRGPRRRTIRCSWPSPTRSGASRSRAATWTR